MSGTMAEQDNSIEEILASIRQIISDDDPKAGENAVSDAAPAAAPVQASPEPAAPAPVSSQGAVDDIFDLVDEVDEKPDFSVTEPEPAAELATPPADTPEPPIEVDLRDPEPEPEPDAMTALDELQKMVDAAPASLAAPLVSQMTDAAGDSVFSGIAAAATLGAFSKLSETVTLERQRAVAGSVTLEDIVKELLTPILRQWIDQHVPGLVERLVREELEKLARQAREG